MSKHSLTSLVGSLAFSAALLFGSSAIAQTTNSPPVISLPDPPASTIWPGNWLHVHPVATDANKDRLTFSIVNKPSWATFDPVNGYLDGVPGSAGIGTYSNIVISVSDGKTSVSLPPIGFRVPASNTPPSISGTPPATATVGVRYTFRPSASDIDGQTLTFYRSNAPSWAAFNTSTGELTGVPTSSNVGTYSGITIGVSDGSARTALPMFTINVVASSTSTSSTTTTSPTTTTTTSPTTTSTTTSTTSTAATTTSSTSTTGNIAPTITAVPPPSTIWPGNWLHYHPVAADANRDRLTFSIVNKPAWASFDPYNGYLDGTPGPAGIGTYSNIQVSVSDGKTTVSLPAFGFRVPASNTPPTISGTPSGTAKVDVPYYFKPSASDIDGQTLRYYLTGRPVWATFNVNTGELSGTPTSGDVGTYSNILIQVGDGSVKTSLPVFSISVSSLSTSSTNTAPAISGAPSLSVVQGTTYSFQPTASDANGDPLTFSVVNKPAWLTFSTSTGRLSGIPSASDVAQYQSIQITVSDGKSSVSLAPFSLNVIQAGTKSITVSWLPPTTNTDGSTLTNLAGHRIYYGNTSSTLDRSASVTGSGLTSYVISNLAVGTYYVSVAAVNSSGIEGPRSAVVGRTVN